jgi:hypothetical protein
MGWNGSGAAIFTALYIILWASSGLAAGPGFTPGDFGRTGHPWPAIIGELQGGLRNPPAAGEDPCQPGFLRARALLGLGEPGLARDSFRRWLADSPLSSWRPAAALGLAVAEAERGDPRAALEAARKGRADFPRCVEEDEFLYWEGEAALRGEDYPAAETAYGTLLSR